MMQSAAHSYAVIARLRVGQGYTCLLVHDESGTACLLLNIEDLALIRRLTSMFIAFKDNEAFSDFIEGFSHENGFCAVFAHRTSEYDLPVKRALAGAPLQVKAEAMRSLIGGLMEQAMPSPVICDVLRPKNLLCSTSGKTKFVYDLALHADYDRDCSGKAQIMLAEIARSLFADVSVPALQRFISTLEASSFVSIDEIYVAFAAIADEIAASQVTVTRQPLLKDRLAAMGARLSVLFMPAAAFLLLTVLLLVFCHCFFFTVISPSAVDNGITEIGTVKIYDHKEP